MSIYTLKEHFDDLLKVDPQLAQALSATRKVAPDAANVLARRMFTDTMVPRMGNKMAYHDFIGRHANDGIHASIDLNDFGVVNKLHGSDVGDSAIKSAGNTVADVARLFGAKSYRRGGDELVVHLKDPDHAHAFSRELRSRLEKLPKVGSYNPSVHGPMGISPDYKGHNIAASIGLGYTPEHAEQALIQAKSQLGPKDVNGHRQNYHKMGEAPTVVHSSLHDPPPQGWKPAKGKPSEAPHEIKQPHLPGPGKLNNPLP